MSNTESTDTLFIDGDGRLTLAVSVRSGVRYEVASGYRDEGTRSTLTARRVTPTAWTRGLTFDYDSLMRVKSLPDFSGKLTAIDYNRDGAATSVTLPTGTSSSHLTETVTYTSAHRPSTASYNRNLSSLNEHYSYDALERMTSRWRGPTFNDRYIRTGTLDALGRLTGYSDSHYWVEQIWHCNDPMQFSCPDDGYWEEIPHTDPIRSDSYTYNAVGNRTDNSANYDVNKGNRLTGFDGWTMSYDADGNVTQKQKSGTTQTYTWNAVGQLTQVVVNGVTTTYGYDGLGRRVRKTVNGVMTRYLYDGANLVVEMNSGGQPVKEYSYYPGIDQPHAVRRESDGAVFYYVTEQPGHVVALVNSSNQVVNSYEYEPFGAAISTSESVPQPFRFAGREYDAETGLYYMRARYYDPGLARFISEDPIGLAGGINPYAFGGNDPINNIDPFGLDHSKYRPSDCNGGTSEYLVIDVGRAEVTSYCALGGGGISVIGSFGGFGGFGSGTGASGPSEGARGGGWGGGAGGSTAGPSQPHSTPAKPKTINWGMCRADATQFGLAFVQSALGIGAFRFAKGFYALATTEGAWASAQITTNFVTNAALLPSMMATRAAAARAGGTPNPFDGFRGGLYYVAKMAPIVGAGLELGEAINSCTGRTQ